ncbi:esterase-like activity of phytase family protein [Belnapia rosea]|uniref:esterase-like activity of phytase family protein n=1 Tax=Belnapia rosea TaxID=938405 RepID=UPI0008921799|nr:esterase-like activity of phytase family protein [Belnapia rosea]SDB37811.1 hypothetical protein SAMN02927895_01418 [Belnapia rosea]
MRSPVSRGLSRRSLLATLVLGACSRGGAQSPARILALSPLPAGSRLEALGGLELDDGVLGFGGLSALHIDDDLRLTAISDLGHWVTARLALREGRPEGLADLRTGPLRDGSGIPLRRGYGGDAESLARLPDGSWLVGFERWQRIRRYRDISGPGEYVEAPPGLEFAPRNGGLESLAVLPDGRWLAIAESFLPRGDESLRRAWIGGPGAWRRLVYRPAEGFNPADMAPLPGGGALVLERSFSIFAGFGGRVVRLSAAQLNGAVLEGEEILRLDAPVPRDNYEGITVFRHAGRTLVALVSDDNENMLQRTLLLVFAVVDE